MLCAPPLSLSFLLAVKDLPSISTLSIYVPETCKCLKMLRCDWMRSLWWWWWWWWCGDKTRKASLVVFCFFPSSPASLSPLSHFSIRATGVCGGEPGCWSQVLRLVFRRDGANEVVCVTRLHMKVTVAVTSLSISLSLVFFCALHKAE